MSAKSTIKDIKPGQYWWTNDNAIAFIEKIDQDILKNEKEDEDNTIYYPLKGKIFFLGVPDFVTFSWTRCGLWNGISPDKNDLVKPATPTEVLRYRLELDKQVSMEAEKTK